jgi:signal transduction histidine kinase
VKVIMVATVVMALLMAGATGRRRALLERKRQLERALGASQRLVEDSMQVALSTTLLSLGHFLHELRNSQTAVSANLAYLELSCDLNETASTALSEARQAQEAQGELVRSTIDQLREKSRTKQETFLVAAALRGFERQNERFKVTVRCDRRPIAVTGYPEHFSLVLNNLIRNARQAGARRVCLESRMGPSGQSLHLLVHDDGPGIPRDRRDELFMPFQESTKPEGSGLGLYLCRRYIELFGGTLTLQEGPLGGAAFLIQIPAAIDPALRSDLDAAPVNRSA